MIEEHKRLLQEGWRLHPDGCYRRHRETLNQLESDVAEGGKLGRDFKNDPPLVKP